MSGDELTVQDVLNVRWERLTALAGELGLSPADLVANYVDRGMADTEWRRERMLRDLTDHSRIKGWMVDGTPILKTGER